MERPTDWRRCHLINLAVFLIRTQFCVYMGSLRPMLQQMDPAASDTFFAWMVALCNLGTLIATALSGWIASSKRVSVAWTAKLAVAMMFLTNTGYLFLDALPDDCKASALLLIRAVVGFATGLLYILDSLWSVGMPERDRAMGSAYAIAATNLGTCVGPLLQYLATLTSLGYPGTRLCGFLHLHVYNLPAVFAFLITVVVAILMSVIFLDDECSVMESVVHPSEKDDRHLLPTAPSPPSSVDCKRKISRDWVAICCCLLVQFAQQFAYSHIETNMPLLVEVLYGRDELETAAAVSLLIALAGASACLMLFLYNCSGLIRKVENRMGVAVALMVLLLFLLSMMPGPWTETVSLANCSHPWCFSTSRVPEGIYWPSNFVVLAVAFPLLTAHTSATLVDAVARPEKRQLWLGITWSLGTAGRFVGPLVWTPLLHSLGPSVVWAVILLAILTVTLLLLAFFHRLLPPSAKRRTKEAGSEKTHSVIEDS